MKKILTVSSLDKIFPNEKPQILQSKASVLKNQVFHYQVACFSDVLFPYCHVEIISPIADFITVRCVEPIAGHLATKKGCCDDYVLKKKKDGVLYPDLLRPLHDGMDVLREKTWTVFWVTVNHDEKELPAGEYEVEFVLSGAEDTFGKATFTLSVLDERLPPRSFDYTNWLHYDCIAQYHKLEVFSDEYYQVLNEYIKTAVAHGMTMLYTPLFTPTLDTKVGSERLTVQLVDVTVAQDGEYVFGFEKLARFMENARDLGIKKFEFSHLSTQWGAFFCPKVIARKDGKEVKLFGWDTFSCSAEYLKFLDGFLRSLREFLEKFGYLDCVAFHVSDEPLKEHLDNFIYIKDTVRRYFPDATIMDALGDPEFYERGIVDCPVVSTDHAEKFQRIGALRWTYYCTSQSKEYLSNRFFNMPSQRTRVLGLQLYESGVEGFLHWGFNFYNSFLSMYPIDPYWVTDAGGAYQSGDCFIVYPTEKGVLESLRLEVFYDGLNDYRALKKLEELYGKAFVTELLHTEGVSGFKTYPRNAEWHIAFREKVNALIAQKN